MASMASPTGLTQHLARFLRETSFSDLPAQVVDTSKNMMINAAAVGLAAAGHQDALTVTRFVQAMRGNGKCTVIGMGLRTSQVNAALANGTLIHLLDFDDEVLGRDTHPSSVIFPVVMALAEMNGYAGPEVLAAFALGCEIISKLASMAQPGQIGAPPPTAGRWHGEGIAGAVGAAAAAGLLLQLDQERMESALGIACGGAGGIQADSTSPSRALQCGRAAMNGVTAALLAQQGFSGPKHAIEAAGGLLATYGNGESVDEQGFLSRLANPYDVVQPGITLKPYPCHLASHTAIDAVYELVQQFQIDPGQVQSITVRATPDTLEALPYNNPGSGREARFSLNYAVAAALVHGQPLIEQFTDDAVQDPAVRAVMDRVSVEPISHSNSLMSSASPIAVKLSSGRELQHQVEFSRGRPELPLEVEDLDAKFLYCCRYILPPDHIDGALTQFRALEEVNDVTGLASILGG